MNYHHNLLDSGLKDLIAAKGKDFCLISCWCGRYFVFKAYAKKQIIGLFSST